jgi:hypothetical protein
MHSQRFRLYPELIDKIANYGSENNLSAERILDMHKAIDLAFEVFGDA